MYPDYSKTEDLVISLGKLYGIGCVIGLIFTLVIVVIKVIHG